MAQTWAGASVSSAAYTSSTGDLALTFASAPFGAGVGSTLNGAVINVTGLAGTNATLLNQQWVITSTATAGTVIHLGANAGLGVGAITASTGAIDAGTGTYVSYGDAEYASGRASSLLGNVGGQSMAFTPTSAGTTGTVSVAATSCASISTSFLAPIMDVTVQGGVIVDVYPSGKTTATSNTGWGITSNACLFTTGVTGGSVTALTFGPNEGQGGIATMTTDNNLHGVMLYDNSGESGNPLFSTFANPANSGTSYFEPGLPAKTWGQALGSRVSG
jgi:hypothetical protein